MKIALVQINLWEKPTYFQVNDVDLALHDYVVAETITNVEIGKVLELREISEADFTALNKDGEGKSVIRKANLKDLETLESQENNKDEVIEICKKLIIKHQLPMKLVDVHFSFDNKKLTFAFIAESRVDFRQLVKDLTRSFQKNIRLQQLGVRDEAKINGDIGACGITQCCKTHLKELGNVSAEQAETQQISHRGPERLSGICNRLKCCLRYENELYKDLSAKLPALGSVVKTQKGKATVVDWHILKQSVSVRLEGDDSTILEVPVENLSK